MSSTAALSRARRLPGNGTVASTSDIVATAGGAGWYDPRLFFGDDDDGQGNGDIGRQMQLHDVLAGLADRTVGQAHFRALDLVAGLGHAFGDVRSAHRAEQLAFAAG